jgi:hypothetical protein
MKKSEEQVQETIPGKPYETDAEDSDDEPRDMRGGMISNLPPNQ